MQNKFKAQSAKGKTTTQNSPPEADPPSEEKSEIVAFKFLTVVLHFSLFVLHLKHVHQQSIRLRQPHARSGTPFASLGKCGRQFRCRHKPGMERPRRSEARRWRVPQYRH